MAQVKLPAGRFTWDDAKATIARAHSSVNGAQEFVGFGMAFSKNLTLSGVLPETPSSLGAPLFAELLGGAELAPLLVKFFGDASCPPPVRAVACYWWIRVFGSVIMWMLILFNPSPTFRVFCITVAAFSLMGVLLISPCPGLC